MMVLDFFIATAVDTVRKSFCWSKSFAGVKVQRGYIFCQFWVFFIKKQISKSQNRREGIEKEGIEKGGIESVIPKYNEDIYDFSLKMIMKSI
eukprot:UN21376